MLSKIDKKIDSTLHLCT